MSLGIGTPTLQEFLTRFGGSQEHAIIPAWLVAVVSIGMNALLLLALATNAAAALWVRITLDPASPRVGEAAQVSVLTFYLTQDLCVDDPRAIPVPTVVSDITFSEFILEASGPSAPPERVLVYLSRRASDPTYWDGPITFPSPGQWSLRMVRPGFPEPYAECLGAKKVVTVLPSALPRTGAGEVGPAPVVLVLSAVMAVAGAAIALTKAGWMTRHR